MMAKTILVVVQKVKFSFENRADQLQMHKTHAFFFCEHQRLRCVCACVCVCVCVCVFISVTVFGAKLTVVVAMVMSQCEGQTWSQTGR